MNLDVGTLEHAFQSKISMERGRGRGFCGKRRCGRGRSQSRDQSEQTKEKSEQSGSSSQDHSQRWIDKLEIQCRYCKKYGHHISECRKLQYKHKANVTKSETSDAMFLSCQVS